MTTWEFRLAEQYPIRVQVDDTRNLAAEFDEQRASLAALLDEQPPRWRFWSKARHIDPQWCVTPEVRVHIGAVLAVVPKRSKTRSVVGFLD